MRKLVQDVKKLLASRKQYTVSVIGFGKKVIKHHLPTYAAAIEWAWLYYQVAKTRNISILLSHQKEGALTYFKFR